MITETSMQKNCCRLFVRTNLFFRYFGQTLVLLIPFAHKNLVYCQTTESEKIYISIDWFIQANLFEERLIFQTCEVPTSTKKPMVGENSLPSLNEKKNEPKKIDIMIF